MEGSHLRIFVEFILDAKYHKGRTEMQKCRSRTSNKQDYLWQCVCKSL